MYHIDWPLYALSLPYADMISLAEKLGVAMAKGHVAKILTFNARAMWGKNILKHYRYSTAQVDMVTNYGRTQVDNNFFIVQTNYISC